MTRTPWAIVDDQVVRSIDGSNIPGLVVRRMKPEDAASIVRAVNANHALVEALRGLRLHAGYCIREKFDEALNNALREADKALALAEGKS